MKQIKIKTLYFLIIIVGLTSCLKKDRMNIDPDQGTKNVVEFANTGDNVASAALSTYPRFNTDLGSLASGASLDINVNVSYSGAETAPQDITVNLALDPEALTRFNTENSTNYVVPPASVVSFPPLVVIKKGEHQATVAAKVTNSTAFDFSKAYALPLKIASASQGVISANFGKAIYSFAARNSYDGMYSYSGSTYRNSATGPDPALSGEFTNGPARPLATVSGNSVFVAPLWANGTGIAGIDNTYITIDPVTNLVTMASLTNATLKNTVGKVNKYDPATKTFTLAFDWGADPNTRVVTMTLTYIGPR